jgi:hypothetical protein
MFHFLLFCFVFFLCGGQKLFEFDVIVDTVRYQHCVFINTAIVWDINQHFLLQQQHSSSSKTTQTKRVDVGEAPKIHYID